MIRLLAKLGRFNTVAIITVIAAAASVLVTTCAVLILNTYYGFSIRLNVALALVIGVTLVVAPLINWILVGIMLRIYRLEKELRNLASYDSLTGLLSRHAFLENANRAISLANRHQAAFAVLIIDLDHLKSINDLHGNPAGDAVLKLLADVVNSVARRSDIVGRLGGEEFAMLDSPPPVPAVSTVSKTCWHTPTWRFTRPRAMVVTEPPSSITPPNK
jgi:predicted signal transduction protein with EAL and GGDEF domain